jgi:hypothetical protein
MSDESYAVANEHVRAGDLGKVVLVQIDYSRNYQEDFWAGDDYPIDPSQAGRKSGLESLARTGSKTSMGSGALLSLAALLGLFGRHRHRFIHTSVPLA